VPEEIRARCEGIEWRKITAMRNVLAHEYFGIKVEILWDVIRSKLPILEREIKKVLAQQKHR